MKRLLLAIFLIPMMLQAQQPEGWNYSEPGGAGTDLSYEQEYYSRGYQLLSTATPYMYSAEFAVTEGESYTFALPVFDNDKAELKIYCEFKDASDGDIYGETPVYSDNSENWQVITWTGTVPTDAVKGYVWIKVYDETGFSTSADFKLGNAQFVANAGTNVIPDQDFILDEPTGAGLDLALNTAAGGATEGMISGKYYLHTGATPYMYSAEFDVTEAENYTFSIDILDNELAELKVYCEFKDASDGDIYGETPQYSVNQTDWQTITWAGTVPAGAVKGYVWIKVYDETGFADPAMFWLDNASFIVGAADNAIPNGGFESWIDPVMVSMAAQTVTNAAGQTVTAQSNRTEGSVYIVLDGEAQSTMSELDAAVAADKGAKATIIAADTDVTISTEGLTAGVYYAYAVDGAGELSEMSENSVTVQDATASALEMIDEDFDAEIPVDWTIINANEGAGDNGSPEHTWYHHETFGRNGTGVAALDTYPGPADDYLITPKVKLSDAYTLGFWAKGSSSYNDNLSVLVSKTGKEAADFTVAILDAFAIPGGYDYYEFVPTDHADLNADDEVYIAFYVNTEGSFFDIDDVYYGPLRIQVAMSAQTVENGTGAEITAQSNFSEGSVYLVLDGEAQSNVTELDAAVAASKGAKAAVTTADTDVAISVEGLTPGIYYAYAVDASDNMSEMSSNSATIQPATVTAVETFFEDFEDGLPVEWTIINANEGAEDNGDDVHTWAIEEGTGKDDGGGLILDTHPGPADDWFISPLTKLTDGYVFSLWTSGSTQYPDSVSVYVSKTGKEVADFTILLGKFEVPGPFTKFSFTPTDDVNLAADNEVYLAIHCATHGSKMYVDDIQYAEFEYGNPQFAYSYSDDRLDVIFDGPVGGGDEVAANWMLKGTSDITFSTATVNAEDNKLLHLSGASASVTADVTVDSIVNTASEYVKFYAGVAPLSMANIANAGGYLEEYSATFKVIVMHKNLEDDGTRTCVADASAVSGGMLVYGAQFWGLVNVGDEILIYSTVSPYANQTELFAPTLVETISTGNSLFDAVVISGADLDTTIAADTNPAEQWEGTFVKVEDAKLLSYDAPYFYMTDDDGATKFRVGNGFDIFTAPFGESLMAVGSSYDVTGFVVNRDGDYRVVPRTAADIVLKTDIENKANDMLTVYPNPASSYLRISNSSQIQHLSIYNIEGAKIMETEDLCDVIIVDHLSSGLYIMKAATLEGKIILGKFIKL